MPGDDVERRAALRAERILASAPKHFRNFGDAEIAALHRIALSLLD